MAYLNKATAQDAISRKGDQSY